MPGPNSLWHIDGHDSWGFNTHGGVDGFFRLIIYLYCSTNNKANTAGVVVTGNPFGVPSMVQSDHGGENVGVCKFMITYRGVDRASHIAGSCVRNRLIERMWRDVFRCVCSTFYLLFYILEVSGYVDPGNNCDLYDLQAMYSSSINLCLRKFLCGWNHHPLRIERHWSPKKIWISGMVDPNNRDLTAVHDIIDPLATDATAFGVDRSRHLPLDLSEDPQEAVVVEEVVSPGSRRFDLFDPSACVMTTVLPYTWQPGSLLEAKVGHEKNSVYNVRSFYCNALVMRQYTQLKYPCGIFS